MTPDLFWIPGPWRGRLAVVTRPRGGDWLEDEVEGWKRAGLDVVVSLLERDEAIDLGLDLESEIALARGIGLVSFPIPDRGIPTDHRSTSSLISGLSSDLHRGKNVAVHCRQGIGRSGLIAAAVLVSSGLPSADAISAISTARGIIIPETPEQLAWIHRFALERIGVGQG